MNHYQKLTPEGVGDLLFTECDRVHQVEEKTAALFRARGFSPVMTPGLEFYDVFALQNPYIPTEEMVKLTDGKGRLLVLRPDSTIPIARLAATRLSDAEPPLRLWYRQNIYEMSGGQVQETRQTGVEMIGAGGAESDLEAIRAALDTLDAVDLPDYRLEIGHAGFLLSVLGEIPGPESLKEDLRACVRAKNRMRLDDLTRSLPDSDALEVLREMPRLFGGAEILDQAESLPLAASTREVLAGLRSLFSALSGGGYGEKILIDLGLVHHNRYYTGIIFRGYTGGGDTVLQGGRYDHLLQEFGRPLPATGFGLDITALLSEGKRG